VSNATTAAERLEVLLAGNGLAPLTAEQRSRFAAYLSLILRWNTRTNLTALRDEDGMMSRHLLECIACAQVLPGGIGTLLDFGSGAGLPGIPIALCRPEIAVTLAESQGKKAAFLQEAVRTLGLAATVYPGRAEALAARFDCVALRAVDRMVEAVSVAAGLVAPGGWLALMTTRSDFKALQAVAGEGWTWADPVALPDSEQRIVGLGRR